MLPGRIGSLCSRGFLNFILEDKNDLEKRVLDTGLRYAVVLGLAIECLGAVAEVI